MPEFDPTPVSRPGPSGPSGPPAPRPGPRPEEEHPDAHPERASTDTRPEETLPDARPGEPPGTPSETSSSDAPDANATADASDAAAPPVVETPAAAAATSLHAAPLALRERATEARLQRTEARLTEIEDKLDSILDCLERLPPGDLAPSDFQNAHVLPPKRRQSRTRDAAPSDSPSGAPEVPRAAAPLSFPTPPWAVASPFETETPAPSDVAPSAATPPRAASAPSDAAPLRAASASPAPPRIVPPHIAPVPLAPPRGKASGAAAAAGAFLAPEDMETSAGAQGRPRFSSPRILEETEMREGAEPGGGRTAFEVGFGSVWLPRIGGILLLIGVAIAATLIQPKFGPGLRLLSGYLLSAGLGVAGIWVNKRSQTAGRACIAIALAVGYFMSFASHYIAPTRVFAAPVAIALMLGFVGGIVGLAERWRSEATAGMGFGLALIAALTSAGTSEQFALIALVMIAFGAGVLLLRNEWIRLTLFSLVGVYGATAILWFLLPAKNTPGEILTHLGALVGYYLIFSVALWRWGRPWQARERAAEQAPAQHAIPELDPAILHGDFPYSTAANLFNSLALVGLSLFLFWKTKTLWPLVDWLLFGLAAVEGLRAFERRLSTPMLQFRALAALALTAAGISAAFGDLAECAIHAALVLIACLAGSHDRRLHPLRTVSAAGAAIAAYGYAKWFGGVGTLREWLLAIVPGVLLLASALPPEVIGGREPRPPFGRARTAFDTMSGAFRAFVGFVMVAIASASCWEGSDTALFLALGVLAHVTLLGVVVLRARHWFPAAAIGGLVSLGFYNEIVFDESLLAVELAGLLWLVAGVLLWQDLERKAKRTLSRVGMGLALIPMTLLAVAAFVGTVEPWKPYQGIALGLIAAGGLFLGVVSGAIPPLPVWLGKSVAPDEADDAEGHDASAAFGAFGTPASSLSLHGLTLKLGYWIGAGTFAAALVVAVFFEATESIASAVFLAMLMGVGVVAMSRRNVGDTPQFVVAQTALGSAAAALLIYARMEEWSLLVCVGAGAGVLGFGIAARHAASALAGLLLLLALGVLQFGAYEFHGRPDTARTWTGLIVAAALIGSTRLVPAARKALAQRPFLSGLPGDPFGVAPTLWLIATGALGLLIHLTYGGLIAKEWITVSWAAVGIALLAGGFVWLEAPMRHVSLGVLALATGRIFFVDLAGRSLLTQAIAFVGVGLVLVLAGMAYGAWRQRLLPTRRTDDTDENAP